LMQASASFRTAAPRPAVICWLSARQARRCFCFCAAPCPALGTGVAGALRSPYLVDLLVLLAACFFQAGAGVLLGRPKNARHTPAQVSRLLCSPSACCHPPCCHPTTHYPLTEGRGRLATPGTRACGSHHLCCHRLVGCSCNSVPRSLEGMCPEGAERTCRPVWAAPVPRSSWLCSFAGTSCCSILGSTSGASSRARESG
jgi:hypothetical protein